MRNIDAILKQIDQLKPVSQVANKIMSIAQNPNSSMSELSNVILYDQALTANLLKICNSAYFGLPKEVESVHQAIVYLGVDQVIDLVLISGGADNLKIKQEGYDLSDGELWKFSVSSALLSRDLAEMKGFTNHHLLFTAALIKDIGKVILGQYVADTYEVINKLVTERDLSFMEAERAVIGIDHAELGGKVAEKWKYSTRMVEIIRNHHSPHNSSKAEFETSIVYLADTLCMMMGIGVGADGLSYRFHKDVVNKLGFTEMDFQTLMAGFGEKLHKVEELMNLT